MRKPDLPIFEIERRLLETLSTEKRLVLTAPTGSGKSTQVPQMLLDGGLLGNGRVTVLQPRRLPTRMLAAWVARSRNVKLGGEVGYQMRVDNVASPDTRICYVTEGVLLRQMLTDPELTGVSAILFDEFHERHLYGDITLARALQIQESSRPDLIIVVMSATLDVAAVQKYLHPCAVLSSQGRTYPVAIEYLSKPAGHAPIWALAAKELQRLVCQHPQGDALIFMPGAYEISRTVQAVRDTLGQTFVVFPLHGELPPSDQDAAVARYDRRKVVVSTNVAETSLTIDGVRLVIDSGLARIPRYDPYRGINTLLVEKISRAAADQRAGRAGRTAPGHCLRLWTEHEQGGRPAQELPEVRRLDLSEVMLTLKASGVNDVRTFPWLEVPDARAIERAETLLTDLGALHGRTGVITPLGRRMLAFPAHPRYARMLLAAHDYRCVRPVALIAALTQGRDLLARRQGTPVEDARDDLFGAERDSDFFVLMRAWRYAERNGYDTERCRRLGIHAQAARQVGPLLEQFLRIGAAEGLDISEKPLARAMVQRCVLLGFPDHLARRLNTGTLRCELVHGRRGVLARESVVQKAPLFIASEVREVESRNGKDRELNIVLNLATAIEEEWLRELFPEDFNEAHAVVYDTTLRRVFVRDEKRFRDLVLEEKLSDNPPAEEATRILAREVAAGRCALTNWNESVEQWILRVNRLREWMPELGLPAIGEEDREAMLQQICHRAISYNEIKDRPVWPVVKSWLSRQQQAAMEKYAPERLALPRGRAVKVVYSVDAAPTIAARIQDLYGVKDAVWIANRRVPVRIQVLAPNNRSVQITENLSVFWRETYPRLKQDLQRKYPKHDWR
ncbi:MAG: ATP-dependent helicase HrpB [Deltaproteobacteria bacterium]|nr:ATP-dependent helicase HrpB [Deltaproteobacteria bacterium]